MRNQLLLLEDVEDLGRSGELVTVKPGYSRNFLIPQKKAVVADKFTLRMQAKLQEERSRRAAVDKKESEEIAQKIQGITLDIEVKVDPDGHMYGSVTALDIVRLFETQGIHIERKGVLLLHPIKTLGFHSVQLKLKEGVPVQVTLNVLTEAQMHEKREEIKESH